MPRVQRIAQYASIDHEMLSQKQGMDAGITFDQRYFVRCTGLGNWSGSDVIDTVHRVRGELGSPHLSYLPALPDRGYAASTLARSIAVLDGLEADGASFGWRLVSGYSREAEKARSLFTSDLNALADTVGKESASGNALKLQFCGPFTLASSLHLPQGERAISDYGAVRDIRDAFIAGLGSWLKLVREAVPDEQIVIQFDEPDLGAAMAGQISTASGLRTYRAIKPEILESSYELLAQEMKNHNVFTAVANAPHPYLASLQSTVNASAFSSENFEERDWEKVATLIEAGQQVWLGVADIHQVQSVSSLAHSLWKSWRTVGLSADQLSGLTLTERGDLSEISSPQATAVLRHLTETARAVSEIAQDQ